MSFSDAILSPHVLEVERVLHQHDDDAWLEDIRAATQPADDEQSYDKTILALLLYPDMAQDIGSSASSLTPFNDCDVDSDSDRGDEVRLVEPRIVFPNPFATVNSYPLEDRPSSSYNPLGQCSGVKHMSHEASSPFGPQFSQKSNHSDFFFKPFDHSSSSIPLSERIRNIETPFSLNCDTTSFIMSKPNDFRDKEAAYVTDSDGETDDEWSEDTLSPPINPRKRRACSSRSSSKRTRISCPTSASAHDQTYPHTRTPHFTHT